MLTNTSSSTREVSHATSSSGLGQRAPLNVTQASKATSSGARCFGYGETGHRQADYKKQCKKALFVNPDDYEEEDAYAGEEPVFDGTNEGDEKVLEGDTGTALVVRWMCLTPHANRDEWLRNNIFQSTCTIQEKVCYFVIDSGSYENIVSTEAVQN